MSFLHYDLLDEWMGLIDDLDLPSDVSAHLPSEHPAEALGESTVDRLDEMFEDQGPEEARKALRKELSAYLREEAASARSTAARLQKSADSLRVDGEEIPDFVGANLSSIRSSCGKSQRQFVEENLQGALARSTYADLERGNTASMRSDTIEEMARALESDPRLLLTDKALLRALHALLARHGTWRGKTSRSSRSIREALKEALHSDVRDELVRIVGRSGPAASQEIMDCLLRIPPLDNPEFDTPATRYGALLGWRWGIPEEEEDLVSHVVRHVEDYTFTDFPELGGRIVGAVILGFWGYYLTRAALLSESGDQSGPIDFEIYRDYSDWADSHLPGAPPEK